MQQPQPVPGLTCQPQIFWMVEGIPVFFLARGGLYVPFQHNTCPVMKSKLILWYGLHVFLFCYGMVYQTLLLFPQWDRGVSQENKKLAGINLTLFYTPITLIKGELL